MLVIKRPEIKPTIYNAHQFKVPKNDDDVDLPGLIKICNKLKITPIMNKQTLKFFLNDKEVKEGDFIVINDKDINVYKSEKFFELFQDYEEIEKPENALTETDLPL